MTVITIAVLQPQVDVNFIELALPYETPVIGRVFFLTASAAVVN